MSGWRRFDPTPIGVDPASAISCELPKLYRVTEHRYLDLDGARIFYREAGMPDSPVVLLPPGYPCSSYQFRNLIPALADRWRVIAQDFPGCGYSDTPSEFEYSFDGYARFLDRFIGQLGIERLAIYLHDFGSQIGLRFAILRPGVGLFSQAHCGAGIGSHNL